MPEPAATPETGASADPRAAADPAMPAGGEAPPDPEAEAHLARRRFFRQFAGDLLQTAATVAGAAQAIQRASAEAAGAILDPVNAAVRYEDAVAAVRPPDGPPTGFRTPFREGEGILYVIDQRKLPDALVEVEVQNAPEAAAAIRQMIVRGAPAIGQVAAIGMALSGRRAADSLPYARRAILRASALALRSARPTAVNLGWAVDRMMARYEQVGELSDDGEAIAVALRAEADAIVHEATTDHGRLADFGLAALPVKDFGPLRILTHCNTGPLACGQFGTALGIVQAAHNAEREISVWVDETRPYLQGARLTTWELAQAGVPHTLIPDVAAGHLMSRGEVDVVIVGADRVAANGDTANKVGTYTLAVLAARHGIPFLVCAPTSSIDLASADGDSIEIEERAADEVLEIRGVRIAPPDTEVRNPAFDVTPAELISGIVTEEGVVRAPFEAGLADAIAAATARWAPTRPSPEPPPEEGVAVPQEHATAPDGPAAEVRG
ncbi:MAG TPA: S-methyl-5-thioribose-1-phosphate isomerase [Candidatus Limnocylindrales bacterium]|nr:S-methyl-5-thioribose-1-phosphate isomerase [Candidatus Limnocylindrales bacterium]